MAPATPSVMAAGVGMDVDRERRRARRASGDGRHAGDRGCRLGAARSLVGGVAPAPCQALGAARDDDRLRRLAELDDDALGRRPALRPARLDGRPRSIGGVRGPQRRAHRPRPAPDRRRVRPALRGLHHRGHAGRDRLRAPLGAAQHAHHVGRRGGDRARRVTSWFVGGTYATVVADRHGVEVHSSYSRQTLGRRPAASASSGSRTTRRSAGGVQVVDHWTLGPRAMLDVGGRYERYDYLSDPGLFSPTITASVSPASRTWIRVTAAREMARPGAEEFVPQAYGSLSLPPQRTFSSLVAGRPLGRPGDAARRRRARAGHRVVPGGVLDTSGRTWTGSSRRSSIRRSRPGPAPRRPRPLRGRQRRRLRRLGLGRRHQPSGRHATCAAASNTASRDVAWAVGDDAGRVLAGGAVGRPGAGRADARRDDARSTPPRRGRRRGSRPPAASTRASRATTSPRRARGRRRASTSRSTRACPCLHGNSAQVELVFGVRNLLRSSPTASRRSTTSSSSSARRPASSAA